MSILKRGKTWHLYRRVPKAYHAVESRRLIFLSLKTDSETLARQKAPIAWQQLIEAWEAQLAGNTGDAEQRFDAVQKLAQARGLPYIPAERVAELPIHQLLDRVEAVAGADNRALEAEAQLGGAQEPAITVSRALDLYWGFARDRTLEKSEDQLRRWKNPRIKAVRNFIEVVGNKPIAEISGDDMIDFREWWIERIAQGEVSANSANKDLVHLSDVLKTVNKKKRLGLALPLSDLSVKEGKAKTRPPFSPGWIREHLLVPGALDGLNPEAAAILRGMVNTGMRPSELASLRPEEIRLDHEVPHLALQPIGRQLKSRNAERLIPLLGVSLAALSEYPQGFPRYRDNSATLSGTLNKYLRENGLLETAGHSAYGLRHSFEDRMLEAGIDERIRRDLMGHSLGRERYGEGGRLDTIAALLAPISF